MKPTLPVQLNFMQKAKNGFEIQGKLPLKQLKRLNDVLMSDQGDVEAELKFDKAGHIPFIQGHIRAELHLKCQRCLQAVQYSVDSDFRLGMVQNEEQMDRLPDEFEPYLVEDDNNYLADILEDELLLAMPLVAMHDFDCSEHVNEYDSGQEDEVKPSDAKENPFAALKDLLK